MKILWPTDLSDKSKELLPFVSSLAGLGDNPIISCQGIYWWKIDITYYVLKILSWLGIIRSLNPYPERLMRRDRVEG